VNVVGIVVRIRLIQNLHVLSDLLVAILIVFYKHLVRVILLMKLANVGRIWASVTRVAFVKRCRNQLAIRAAHLPTTPAMVATHAMAAALVKPI